MAKRKNTEEIRAKKAEQFIERTAAATALPTTKVEQLFSHGLTQSVRINTLRVDSKTALEAMKRLGWQGEQSGWCADGYSIAAGYEQLRDSSLVQNGDIYIQNRSSWVPVVALDPKPGEAILDVCAAPGSKTSHIAARMQNSGYLVANDNSRPRLMKLQSNMQRLGAEAHYTLHDATKLARQLDGEQFDKILLDAPCSGEGLIDLSNPRTLDTWSVAHIRRLASLQKQLILQAFQLLKPGGTLVYSTCTLAPEEDEMVIDWLLRREQNAKITPLAFSPAGETAPVLSWNDKWLADDLKYAKRILPIDGGEAFFTCAIKKAE
jgi:16S rRNA (cytosine1407-C5)-methyltransferase